MPFPSEFHLFFEYWIHSTIYFLFESLILLFAVLRSALANYIILGACFVLASGNGIPIRFVWVVVI